MLQQLNVKSFAIHHQDTKRCWKKRELIIYTSGPGCSKPDQGNPGLARILILVLQLFGGVFCLYCLPFSSEL